MPSIGQRPDFLTEYLVQKSSELQGPTPMLQRVREIDAALLKERNPVRVKVLQEERSRLLIAASSLSG
jgi:hypothetical protein